MLRWAGDVDVVVAESEQADIPRRGYGHTLDMGAGHKVSLLRVLMLVAVLGVGSSGGGGNGSTTVFGDASVVQEARVFLA